MRRAERDALVVVLAIASGSADGWSYFGLGHAFVANMTGNTVMLGVSVFHLHGDFLHPLISVVCYCVGTAVGTLLSRRIPPGALWTRGTSWTLFLEALLLIAAEVAWVATGHNPGSREALVLLACVAAGIGLQSAAMVQLKVPGVATTYITGTWTTLVNGLTLFVGGRPRQAAEKAKLEERFEVQAAVLACYFLSAVLTGWAFRHAEALVGAIAAGAVLVVAAYGALRD